MQSRISTSSTRMARLGLMVIAALTIPALASAQQQDSASGRSRGMAWDASQAVTKTGMTVVRVDTTTQGMRQSISALLANGADSVHAMIAPAEFLASKSFTLASGDVIDISGTTSTMGGRSMLVASEIKKGTTTVTLRDKATGTPAWAPSMRQP